MVMMNRIIHQRGIGLFSSRRSSSHVCPVGWPVVPDFPRAVIRSSARQAARLTIVTTAM
jgi:hypothetical protein